MTINQAVNQSSSQSINVEPSSTPPTLKPSPSQPNLSQAQPHRSPHPVLSPFHHIPAHTFSLNPQFPKLQTLISRPLHPITTSSLRLIQNSATRVASAPNSMSPSLPPTLYEVLESNVTFHYSGYEAFENELRCLGRVESFSYNDGDGDGDGENQGRGSC